MTANQKNDPPTENEAQNTGLGKKSAYVLLIVLSTISVFVILSLWLVLVWGNANGFGAAGGEGMIGLVMLMVVGQWILVIPATLLVVFLQTALARRRLLHQINPLALVGLPLLFKAYVNLSAAITSRNLVLTAKDESIVKAENVEVQKKSISPYVYQLVLHIENNTGQKIHLLFELGDDTTEPYQDFDTAFSQGHILSGDHLITPDSDQNELLVSVGVSDVPIKLQFDRTDAKFDCRDGTFVRTLHLLYLIDGSQQANGSLILNSPSLRRLQEMICQEAP